MVSRLLRSRSHMEHCTWGRSGPLGSKCHWGWLPGSCCTTSRRRTPQHSSPPSGLGPGQRCWTASERGTCTQSLPPASLQPVHPPQSPRRRTQPGHSLLLQSLPARCTLRMQHFHPSPLTLLEAESRSESASGCSHCPATTLLALCHPRCRNLSCSLATYG